MLLKKGFWHLGLVCFALGCFLGTVKSEKDAEVDQLQTQQDFKPQVTGGCPRSGKFMNKDTQCWVSSEPPSSSQTAGENSYCRVVSGSETGLFICKHGHWSTDVPNAEKPINREKKGWWRRRRRRHPPPPPPNTAPYFGSCPQDIDVTARPNEIDAVATFTVQAADKEGAVKLTLSQGKKSGSRFPEGQTQVRYTATDAKGLTASCTFNVRVKVSRCPFVAELATFPHGSQSCSSPEKNIYGSLCRHSCLPGYTLIGAVQVMCLSSSTWNSAFPTCRKVSCGDPGQVTHGEVLCPRGHVYPEYCFMRCDPGYENFGGVNYVTCGSNERWSARFSQCTAQRTEKAKKGWWWRRSSHTTPPPNQAPYFTSCPKDIHVTAPANQKDAIVTFSVMAADKEGSATLTLNEGRMSGSSFREGDTFVRYTAHNIQGLTATCTFNVRVTVNRCPYVAELSRFPQGTQRCNSTEKNLYGSVCLHTCDVGHVLKGQAQVKCLSSRTWSSDFPSCHAVSCGDPGEVAGGQVECPEGHVYPYTCIVQCQPGYQNFNVSAITCGSNGKWSAQISPCIEASGKPQDTKAPADEGCQSGEGARAASTPPGPLTTSLPPPA